jgi:energy-coupling factor transporter transmembrane protein EcfT
MKEAIFSYNKRDSLIHKAPAILKLLILFCVPLVTYFTALPYHATLFAIAVILALIAKIPLKSFLRDLKPIIYYCLFILIIDVLTILLFDKTPMPISTELEESAVSPTISFFTILTEKGNFLLMSRLVVSMAYTSIFFRTTSHLEMRQSLEKIESCLTFGHSNLTFSKAFALFLNFLPQLFAIWNSLDLAWRARGGKRTPRKIVVLLPSFISLSLKKANQTLLALKNRCL